jgi:hypothetical protein
LSTAGGSELIVRDSDGRLVYRRTLQCDPVQDTAYVATLVTGKQVSAIACERPGTAQVFYAKTLDELRDWAARVRAATAIRDVGQPRFVMSTRRHGATQQVASRLRGRFRAGTVGARHTGQPATQTE